MDLKRDFCRLPLLAQRNACSVVILISPTTSSARFAPPLVLKTLINQDFARIHRRCQDLLQGRPQQGRLEAHDPTQGNVPRHVVSKFLSNKNSSKNFNTTSRSKKNAAVVNKELPSGLHRSSERVSDLVQQPWIRQVTHVPYTSHCIFSTRKQNLNS